LKFFGGKADIILEPESISFSKKNYRQETDSVRAFVSEFLVRSNDDNDRIKYGEVYEMYRSFCQNEGKGDIEKKKDFSKRLSGLGFKIANSKRDGNQVCIFRAKLSDPGF